MAKYEPVRLSKAQQGKVSKGKQRQAKMHKAMNWDQDDIVFQAGYYLKYLFYVWENNLFPNSPVFVMILSFYVCLEPGTKSKQMERLFDAPPRIFRRINLRMSYVFCFVIG